MITRTNEEIEQKVREIWQTGRNSWDKLNININQGRDCYFIQISKMYESPGVTFKQLNELAKFFDTLNVETESEFSHGGCETCDYGSQYGFILKISEGDKFKELIE
jgi:hypothetical protein